MIRYFKFFDGDWQQPPLDPPYERDDPRYYDAGHHSHICVGVTGYYYDQETYLPYRKFVWKNVHTNELCEGVERIGIEHPMYNYHVIYNEFRYERV